MKETLWDFSATTHFWSYKRIQFCVGSTFTAQADGGTEMRRESEVWSQAAVAGAPPEGRDWKKTLAVLSGVSHYVPWFTPKVILARKWCSPCKSLRVPGYDPGSDQPQQVHYIIWQWQWHGNESQPLNVPTKMCRGFVKKTSHKDLAPGFAVARRHMCKKNNEVGMPFPSASDFFRRKQETWDISKRRKSPRQFETATEGGGISQ